MSFTPSKLLIHIISYSFSIVLIECNILPYSGVASILEIGDGMIQATGHLDFYPNGGPPQPGCSNSLEDFGSCSHRRSVSIFSQSLVSSCQSVAYECSSYAAFREVNIVLDGFYFFGWVNYTRKMIPISRVGVHRVVGTIQTVPESEWWQNPIRREAGTMSKCILILAVHFRFVVSIIHL